MKKKALFLVISWQMFTLLFFLMSSFKIFSQSEKKQNSSKNFINVFVFLDVECPLSQQYVRSLEALREEFSQKKINFWAVFPTNGITKEDIGAFQAKYIFQYPSIIDIDKKITKKLDAKITPEVFVVKKKGKILYRGAIDNLYYDLGKKRPQASIFYLKDALNNLLQHQQIGIKTTAAIGCDIQR